MSGMREVQGLYYSEEGGEAGVTEVAAHQLWTEPGWIDPVWRDVVPHFHHMSARELARFNAAGAPGCAASPWARWLKGSTERSHSSLHGLGNCQAGRQQLLPKPFCRLHTCLRCGNTATTREASSPQAALRMRHHQAKHADYRRAHRLMEDKVQRLALVVPYQAAAFARQGAASTRAATASPRCCASSGATCPG